jgi:hypothetical protein
VLDTLPMVVAQMPAGASIVLAGRTATPLPLGRLRVKRRVVEIGAAELAFDGREASLLLRELGIDADDGSYLSWPRSHTVGWVRGGEYMEKTVSAILSGGAVPTREGIAITFAEAVPHGEIALTDVRVITMNASRQILDKATILISGNRIVAIGDDVAIPSGAQVFALPGPGTNRHPLRQTRRAELLRGNASGGVSQRVGHSGAGKRRGEPLSHRSARSADYRHILPTRGWR